MAVTDGLIDGPAALHRAICATASGTTAEMRARLDAALAHLGVARAAAARGNEAASAEDHSCHPLVDSPVATRVACP